MVRVPMSCEVNRHRVEPVPAAFGHWISSGSDELTLWVMELEVLAPAGAGPTSAATSTATEATAIRNRSRGILGSTISIPCRRCGAHRPVMDRSNQGTSNLETMRGSSVAELLNRFKARWHGPRSGPLVGSARPPTRGAGVDPEFVVADNLLGGTRMHGPREIVKR